MRVLLKHGANPYIPSSDGQTALVVMPAIARMLDEIAADNGATSPHSAAISSQPTGKNRLN